MTRTDKARRHRRRRAHQEGSHGRSHAKTFEDGQTVVVERGPARSDRSWHRGDPPRHGAQSKRQQQMMSLLDRLGFEPTNEQTGMLVKLHDEGKVTKDDIVEALLTRRQQQMVYEHAVNEAVAKTLDQIEHVPTGQGTATEWENGSRVEILDPETWEDAKQILPATMAGHPTPTEWDELVATAKRRKRGITRFAEAQGYELVEGGDAKVRESWVKG